MADQRFTHAEAAYYDRLDREFEASPYTQAARLLAAIDRGEDA